MCVCVCVCVCVFLQGTVLELENSGRSGPAPRWEWEGIWPDLCMNELGDLSTNLSTDSARTASLEYEGWGAGKSEDSAFCCCACDSKVMAFEGWV